MRSLEDWARAATIVGGAVAVAALWATAFQLRQASRASQSQFWLELRKMMATHDSVHRKLRPGGRWSTAGEGPKNPDDWASVEAYMGLFEHCELMLKKKLIDAETFRAVYRYRLENLLQNDLIVWSKLIQAESGWRHFIDLLDRMGLSNELESAGERLRHPTSPGAETAR